MALLPVAVIFIAVQMSVCQSKSGVGMEFQFEPRLSGVLFTGWKRGRRELEQINSSDAVEKTGKD